MKLNKKITYDGLDNNDKKMLKKNAREIYIECSIKNCGVFCLEDLDFDVAIDILGKYLPSIKENRNEILEWESDDCAYLLDDINIFVESYLDNNGEIPDLKLKDFAKFFSGEDLVDAIDNYMNNNICYSKIAEIIVKNNLINYFGEL